MNIPKNQLSKSHNSGILKIVLYLCGAIVLLGGICCLFDCTNGDDKIEASGTGSEGDLIKTSASDTKEKDQNGKLKPKKSSNPRSTTATPNQLQNPDFFVAIDSDNVNLIKNMIDSGVVHWQQVDSQGYNVLHYAAMNLKINVLKYLLEEVVPEDEVNIFSHSGHSALQLACSGEKAEAVEAATLLLTHSAKVNKVKEDGDDTTVFMSPLFLAVEKGNRALVKVLIKNGANVNEVLKQSGDSVLHYAMRSCKRKIIKNLLDKGADVNVVNGLNRLPIHEAAAQGCVEGLRELILTRRIDKNTLSPGSEEKKFKPEFERTCIFKATPLHHAAMENKSESVEFLFLIQASQKIMDEDENVPERYAMKIANYFVDQSDFEKTKTIHQDVENLMRYCETLSPADSLDYFNHLKRTYLHKNNNPVSKSEDNLLVPKLSEIELTFLKSNAPGMKNDTINDDTGNKILANFFKTLAKNKKTEVNFVRGLSKNVMKNIEENGVKFKF